jgi:hypothetical protein
VPALAGDLAARWLLLLVDDDDEQLAHARATRTFLHPPPSFDQL